MARQPSKSAQPDVANLSVRQMQLAIPRIKKRIDELRRFEPNTISNSDDARSIKAKLSASIDEALVRTFGNDTVEFGRFSLARVFDWPIQLGGTPIMEIRQSLEFSKRRSLGLLDEAVSILEERIEEAGHAPDEIPAERPSFDTENRTVFVVHGHDVGARETVARFLERAKFKPVILHEKASQGKTIIEKFEAHAEVGFAVVLLTPDDFGGAKDGQSNGRARQNVILELGYFIGRLGRDRVCALKSGDVELPSDILGIVWTPLDAAGGWQAALAKELSAAGYTIDWNLIMAA